MADRELSLESKYSVLSGEVVLTGVQALVRVLFDQIRADRRAGLKTGAFVSGYPGSPLGGFDLTLQRTGSLLAEHNVRHVPGVNEDLAATSVWGSQQDGLAPLKDLDGVIGMWYGKSPGVDRSGDVFRQANLHGTGRNGGVLVAAGDDPAAKSSSLPHSSEIALYDAGMPVLVPGSVQDVADLGRHAYEMSRMSGCWVGFKMVTAVADALASVAVDPDRIRPVWPEVVDGGRPWRHAQHPRYFVPDTIEMERELHLLRHEAARKYAAANQVNTVEVNPGRGWLCVVAAGRTFVEVRHALRRLGLGDAELHAGGVRLVKLGMIFPLDRELIRQAATGVQEVLVIEEKRSFVELFVRDALYGTANAPAIAGKRDGDDRPLVPIDGELNADRLLPILAGRLRSRVQIREPGRCAARPPRHILQRMPAQPLYHRHQWLPGGRRSGLPRDGHVDGSRRGQLHADGRRGCSVDRTSPVYPGRALRPECRRRYLLPFRDPCRTGGRGR
jgi:indolepyruvate ferredoxin oxidoreductase